MRKWAVLAILALLLFFPTGVFAQAGVTFKDFSVQLLPEYDQPSMLVIYDFTLADTANIPETLSVKIPPAANLFAVAYNENGNLITASFTEPQTQGDWQVFEITTNNETSFHVEYYEPISTTGAQRQYNYLWPGDYAVNSFEVFVSKPKDATQFSSDPPMDEIQRNADGLEGLGKNFGGFAVGQQFTLLVQYEKSGDALVAPPSDLQPSAPVDENTPGRISLTNYLPYILGGLGVVLIVGGAIYYWQAGRTESDRPRRRRRNSQDPVEEGEAQYCHQCGTRAKPNDRFCRVCGSRLRQES